MELTISNFVPRQLTIYFAILTVALILLVCVPMVSAQRSVNISEAKVYDDRTLTIMLEQLNEQLRNINFIDRTKLAAQLGLTQGFQSKEVSRSLDVSTLPIPKLTTTSTLDSSGDLKVSGLSEERAAFSPTRPTLPDLPVAPTYAPVFGENASDLLDDQVNLTYQIFNLRMILERSLSDRLWTTDAGATYQPRLIAVIGFDVDLHPPKGAQDYAAYAEITITSAAGASAPTLIALMPQEKTYNSVALNTKSTAFGGSAVAKIFTVGYSERRRGQTFYLFRDTDTTTLTYPVSGASTKFAWVFRPVLGRRSVSPEKRHMFAVIALPEDDSPVLRNPSSVRVDTHTYWQKYDRNNLTITPGEKFKESSSVPQTLLIPTTAKAQEALKPEIDSIRWYATDDKNAVVTIEGQKLFTGTSVILGNATLDSESSGLLIKSNQSLQMKTTLAALASGDAVLNARYGSSVPLYINDAVTSSIPEGVKINELKIEPQPGRKTANVRMKLQNRDATVGKSLTTASLPAAQTLIVSVQNTPLARPYDLQDVPCDIPLAGGSMAAKTCVLVQALVPIDLVKDEALVAFKYPFRNPLWADTRQYYDPYAVMDVSRLGAKNKKTTLAISGRGFDPSWKVQLDKIYDNSTASAKLNVIGETLMTLEVDDDALSGYKNLIVLPPSPIGPGAKPSDPVVKAIPPAKPPAPEPTLDDSQAAPTVAQGTGPAIVFNGSDLGAITKATFVDGKPLFSKPGKAGKSVTVFLTPHATAKKGPQSVLLWAGDTIIPAPFIVQ